MSRGLIPNASAWARRTWVSCCPCDLAYAPPDVGPPSIVAKLAAALELEQPWPGRLSGREWRFYRDLAGSVPPVTPRYPGAVGIVASPAAALGELARDVASRLDGEEREAVTIRTRTVAREREAQRDAWQERVKARWDLSPMSTERMMTELARALPEDVLVVDDSITSRSSLLGAINFNDPEQLL